MDRMQRGYFRQAAENKYLKLKRQEFQSWIGQILTLSYLGDYENIRLTQGDGGLDGIILSRAAVVAANPGDHRLVDPGRDLHTDAAGAACPARHRARAAL